MREDEDHFPKFMPLLRRIVILVAVLIAAPVVMWTITAYVRTYVGVSAAPTVAPLPSATDTAATTSNPRPGARDAKTAPTDRVASIDPNAPLGLISTPAAPALASAADTGDRLASPASTMGGDTTSAMPAGDPQPSVAANWPAVDALPPAPPITGPVPLPRKRPHISTVAQANVPLPRNRPEVAAASEPDTPTGPFNWLQGVLQQNQQPPTTDR